MPSSHTASLKTAIADLHCHYPMHLSETAGEPERRPERVPFNKMVPFERNVSIPRRLRQRAAWVDRLRARLLAKAAAELNAPSPSGGWRVSLERLRSGNVRFVFSVLYQPFAELDLGKWPEGRPQSGYFQALMDQLVAVEEDLRHLDPDLEKHKVVRSARDLTDAIDGGQTAFLHCVEGGFHLGATEDEVRSNVAALADAGVVYVTLAHLFFRQVAKNAPALPFLTDRRYRLLFWQWGRRGLPKLGRAAVEEMYHRRILIDISHMREDAIDETFQLLEELDERSGAAPTDHPVIATHVGFRFGTQSYNLSPENCQRIARRGGVIGLIFAQHQINDGLLCVDTKTTDESMFPLKRHIDAIRKHTGSYDNIAIGSDFDGFIKPTLGGFKNIDDLAQLPNRLEELYPDHAQAILSGNAIRVLETMFERREQATSGPSES